MTEKNKNIHIQDKEIQRQKASFDKGMPMKVHQETITILDKNQFPCIKNEFLRQIELILGFSISEQSSENQLTALFNYLTKQEIKDKKKVTAIRRLIEQKIKDIQSREDISIEQGADCLLKNLENNHLRTLRVNERECMVNFLENTINNILIIKNETKRHNGKDIEKYLQEAGINRIAKGLEQACDFWFEEIDPLFPKNKLPISKEKIDDVITKLNSKEIQAGTEKDTLKKNKNHNTKIGKIAWIFNKLQSDPMGVSFIKIIIACIEGQKKEFEDLKEATAEFESNLIGELFFVIPQEEDSQDNWDTIESKKMINGRKILAKNSTRTKSDKRKLLKLLNKAEFNANEAIKDGIGLRFEASSEQDIQDLIIYLHSHLLKIAHNLQLETREIFNEDFLDQNTLKANCPLNACRFDKVKKNNPHENEFFKDARILGTTNNGKEKFEIQFVLVGNTNETGISDHNIYERAQLADAIERNYPEHYISDQTLTKLEEQAFYRSTDQSKTINELKIQDLMQISKNNYQSNRTAFENHLKNLYKISKIIHKPIIEWMLENTNLTKAEITPFFPNGLMGRIKEKKEIWLEKVATMLSIFDQKQQECEIIAKEQLSRFENLPQISPAIIKKIAKLLLIDDSKAENILKKDYSVEYSQHAQNKKEQIKTRFRKNRLEFKTGKYVTVDSKTYRHRLIGSGILQKEDEYKITEIGFKKWIQKMADKSRQITGKEGIYIKDKQSEGIHYDLIPVEPLIQNFTPDNPGVKLEILFGKWLNNEKSYFDEYQRLIEIFKTQE